MHTYEDFICKYCHVIDQAAPETEGLEYRAITGDDSEIIGYSVSEGSATNSKYIKIPDLHDGKPVISISEFAFSRCNSLTSVTMPNSVMVIEITAFEDCTSLTSIKFDGTKAQWEAIDKKSYWNNNTGDYTVTCTDCTLSKAES